MTAGPRLLASIAERLGRRIGDPVPPPPPVPAMPTVAAEALVATFTQKLQALGGHVHPATPGDAVAVTAGLLRTLGATRVFASDAAELGAIRAAVPEAQWLGLEAPRETLLATDVGITGAWLGIAETGTLVLRSDFERSRQASLLPPTHVAWLDSRRLVGTLGAALAQLPRPLPPAVTFVTGPSRTADIELQLVVGVHGPKALHVVLIQS